MGVAERSIVTFRIFGDSLVPSEVTRLLGCEPKRANVKGDVRLINGGEHRYVEKTGSWLLSAQDCRPEDVAGQVARLLQMLPQDPEVWAVLRARYEMDMFCGVFLGSSNDGMRLPAEMLGELSKRGIDLNLDIYEFLSE